MNHTPAICRESEEQILHVTDKHAVPDIKERSKHSYQHGEYKL